MQFYDHRVLELLKTNDDHRVIGIAKTRMVDSMIIESLVQDHDESLNCEKQWWIL